MTRSATVVSNPTTTSAGAVESRRRSVLKWAGGKGLLAPRIAALLPAQMSTYLEPFAGGASVFLALAETGRFKSALLSDTNKELINLYRVLQHDVEGLILALQALPYSEEDYYRIRAQPPSRLSSMERAARLVYLNRTCFNGLYRENASGEFNVPFGRYVNPRICNPARLRDAAAAFKLAQLKTTDFRSACRGAVRGDAVYFDPPYAPLDAQRQSFSNYQAGGFGDSHQRRLAALFGELAERGVHAVLSNSDTPRVRELYAGYELHALQVGRPINREVGGRGPVGELLIVNRRARSRR